MYILIYEILLFKLKMENVDEFVGLFKKQLMQRGIKCVLDPAKEAENLAAEFESKMFGRSNENSLPVFDNDGNHVDHECIDHEHETLDVNMGMFYISILQMSDHLHVCVCVLCYFYKCIFNYSYRF